jgi:hypothetical protein
MTDMDDLSDWEGTFAQALSLPHDSPDEAMFKLRAIRHEIYYKVFESFHVSEVLEEVLDCIIVILDGLRREAVTPPRGGDRDV